MKLPHPKWHIFFMTRIEVWHPMTMIGEPQHTYITDYCSKCNCKYVIKYNDVGHPLSFERVEVEK